jgi:hypothetical protein
MKLKVFAVALLVVVFSMSCNSGGEESKSILVPGKDVPVAASQPPALTPTSTSSKGVEGLAADMLLAEQYKKHKETVRALADTKSLAAFDLILRLRSAELAQVIEKVNTGSYSISDKQKMLVPLEQEKDWADSSITSLSR